MLFVFRALYSFIFCFHLMRARTKPGLSIFRPFRTIRFTLHQTCWKKTPFSNTPTYDNRREINLTRHSTQNQSKICEREWERVFEYVTWRWFYCPFALNKVFNLHAKYLYSKSQVFHHSIPSLVRRNVLTVNCILCLIERADTENLVLNRSIVGYDVGCVLSRQNL